LINRQTKAELYLLACTFIWGGTFVVVKHGLADSSPFLMVAVRFGIAALLFLPFSFRSLLKCDRRVVGKGLILGLLLFSGFAAQTVGLLYTTASKSGFITGMLVVFTPIFQLVIERKPPKMGNLIGVLFVSVGLYLLTSPRGAEFNRGDVLTLVCAVLFALYIVYLDIFTKEYDVSQLTFLQMVVTIGLACVCASVWEHPHFNLTLSLALSLGYLSILATLLTLSLQTCYQKETTPTRAAIIFSLEPVISAVLAYSIEKENIGRLGIVGGAIIVVGLLISELSDCIFGIGEKPGYVKPRNWSEGASKIPGEIGK
jgi:drug/metabolite transporter (DMT)-like permease